MVFCGAFEAKGADLRPGGGRLAVHRHGAIAKFVQAVAQITFSGAQAMVRGQRVRYVTERAVLTLTGDGLRLDEVAPGVDLEADVLARMAFRPLIPRPPAPMAAERFTEQVASTLRGATEHENRHTGNARGSGFTDQRG